MLEAHSNEVFNFLEHYEQEVANWTMLVWPRSDGVSVHDANRKVRLNESTPMTSTYERYDFSDSDQARKFISCKAIAFALNKYEERRSAHP